MYLLRDYLPNILKLDYLKHKFIAFAVSGLLILAAIGGLAIQGLNLGVDFTGGIIIEARLKGAPDLSKIRSELNSLNLGEVNIQTIGQENDILIKAGSSSDGEVGTNTQKIKDALLTKIDNKTEFRKIEFVGAEVGDEMISEGLIAIVLTFVGIMIYVWFRFNWQYSIGIVIGLIHDLLISFGFLVYSGFEVNITTIAAVLTILGYSVNDTVVIYDRIRENLKRFKSKTFAEILNISINETLYRSILTAVTTLIAAAALIMFGGEALRSFSVTVFVGILVGTYSSIFISIPVLQNFGSNLVASKKKNVG